MILSEVHHLSASALQGGSVQALAGPCWVEGSLYE